MADEQEKIPARSKRPYLWLLIVLVLALGAGALYLSNQGQDTPHTVAALPEPAAVVKAPQPSILAPGFDVVSVNEPGMLVAAGKAQAGTSVLLQNGSQTLGETKADAGGDWVLTPEKPLAPGNYDLSLLSVDPKTQVSRRSEKTYALTVAPRASKAMANAQAPAGTPQLNLNPAEHTAAVTQPAAGTEPNPSKVAGVKRGDTLWRLAHRYYGSGMRYGKIAEANKDQIKNPDLIYPNQQLAIPH